MSAAWLLVAVLVPARAAVEVAVPGVHLAGTDADADRLEAEALCRAVDATGVLDALCPAELAPRLEGRAELVLDEFAHAEGRARLEEGRVLYGRAEFDAALPLLEEAVELLEAAPPGTRPARDLIEAWLQLGLTYVGLGRMGEARAAFARVAELDPARRLDPVNYPPKVVRLFDEARAGVLGRAKASVHVEAPEGTRLYVDGNEVLGVDVQLPPGHHALLVVAPDGGRASAVRELAEGERFEWRPELAAPRLASAAGDDVARSREAGALYRALGAHLDAPLVLVAGEIDRGSAVVLQLYEPRTGNFSRALRADAGRGPADALVGLAGELPRLLANDGTLDPQMVAPRAVPVDIADNEVLAELLLVPGSRRGGGDAELPPPPAEPPGHVPWLALAGGGGALAAAGVVTLLVLTGGGDGSGDHGTIVVGPIP